MSEPNPPSLEPYRELTWEAVVLGIAQGIVLNMAFVYVALKLGFAIGGSTVAAIMGYALLRGVLRRGTMVENNINQTIASGINTAGTGVVFTVPALYLLGPEQVTFLPLAIAGVAGAILGVVVIIPLRKQMIEIDRLRFPSGVATSTIIRAGAAGTEKAKLLAWGCAISATWKALLLTGWMSTPDWIQNYGFGLGGHDGDEFLYSFNILPDYVSPVVSLSLMNIAAGLLAGRGGLPFFAGGLLAWWVISPAVVFNDWMPAGTEVAAYADVVYGNMLRPLGIGVLIGGALMGVVMAFPAIVGAFRSLASATKTASSSSQVGGDELKLKSLAIGGGIGVTLFFIASSITPGMTVFDALLATVVGTIWLSLAALIVAQATGMTDISPMSGTSLISVTLMMLLLGGNVPGAMVVGVAVCVAIGQGSDMMQDSKTGFMLGARPIKQQTVQFAVTWFGALLALGVVHVLWQAGPPELDSAAPTVAEQPADSEANASDGEGRVQGGFGSGTNLPAPQGAALAGIIESLSQEDGGKSVPVDKYAMGTVIGLLLGAAPMSGLGVLVGLAMYLPFYITFGYGIGCLLQMAIQKSQGADFCEHRLVPFAAGLIVGEALIGMGDAFYGALMS